MIQKVTLSRGQVLTKDNILKILNNARSSFEYARFKFGNGIYITVSYYRDSSIEVFTNSRDIGLWAQIQSIRGSYSQTRVADFVFRWINSLNK